MKSPLSQDRGWLKLDEVASTQDVANEILVGDQPYGIVLAKNQLKGRGRHGRIWLSRPGDSLTMSLIFRDYADHPSPHLIGMAVAIVAAMSIRSRLQWPNDLVLNSRKVGGIITELRRDGQNRLVPIVGLGINLNQESFDPSISETATSLRLIHGHFEDAEAIAQSVVSHLADLPEPDSWSALRDLWNLFDQTGGKAYKVSETETAKAISIGSNGELLCTIDGEATSILAGDAIFGV